MRSFRHFLVTRKRQFICLFLVFMGVTFGSNAQESAFPNEGLPKLLFSDLYYPASFDNLVKQGKIEEARAMIDRIKLDGSQPDTIEWLKLNTSFELLRQIKEPAADTLRYFKEEFTRQISAWQHPNNVLVTKIYLHLSNAWLRLNMLNEAKIHVDTALIEYKKGPFQSDEEYLRITAEKLETYSFLQNMSDTLIRYCDIQNKLYTDYPERVEKYVSKGMQILLYQRYGNVYSSIGDYSKAISYHYEAMRLLKEEQAKEAAVDADLENDYKNALLYLISAYYSSNQFEQANAYAKEAISAIEEINGYNYRQVINQYNALAVTYSALNKPDSALVWYEKCLKVLNENNGAKALASLIELNMGIAYTISGNEQKSKAYIGKAIRDRQALLGKRSPENVMIHRYMAESYSKFGDHETAINYYDSAFRSMFPNIESIEEVTKIPVAQLSLDALDLVDLYMEELLLLYEDVSIGKGSLQIILDFANMLERALEQKWGDFYETESVLSNARLYKDVFENALAALTKVPATEREANHYDLATRMMNFTKAIVLSSELSEFELINDPDVPYGLRGTFLETKRNFLQLDSRLNVLIQSSLQGDSIGVLNGRKAVLRTQLEQVTDSLKSHYWQGKQQSSLLTNIAQVRERHNIDGKKLLIEYFYGKQEIIVLGISDSKTVLSKIDKDSVLVNRLYSFSKRTADFQKGRSDFKKLAEESTYLYDRLLRPTLDSLDSDATSLVIVPDGILTFLNFELLAREKGKNYASLGYLMKDFSVSLLNSVSSVKETRAKTADKGLLAFGYSQSRGAPRSDLGDLPGARQELQWLQKRFDGSYYMGDQGTKKRFLANSEDYDIIHLALHGKADTLNRYNSSLIFNGEENHQFDAFDLYALNLKSRMVVLSACEAGLGKVDTGEGMFSVARSFVARGVPSVVATLWKVNDLASAEIVKSFYANLSQGMHKDEAMRQAKLTFLENADNLTSHPYFWGSFVVMGDTSPMDIKKASSFSWYWLLALAIVIFVLSRVGRQPRKSKKA